MLSSPRPCGPDSEPARCPHAQHIHLEGQPHHTMELEPLLACRPSPRPRLSLCPAHQCVHTDPAGQPCASPPTHLRNAPTPALSTTTTHWWLACSAWALPAGPSALLPYRFSCCSKEAAGSLLLVCCPQPYPAHFTLQRFASPWTPGPACPISPCRSPCPTPWSLEPSGLAGKGPCGPSKERNQSQGCDPHFLKGVDSIVWKRVAYDLLQNFISHVDGGVGGVHVSGRHLRVGESVFIVYWCVCTVFLHVCACAHRLCVCSVFPCTVGMS